MSYESLYDNLKGRLNQINHTVGDVNRNPEAGKYAATHVHAIASELKLHKHPEIHKHMMAAVQSLNAGFGNSGHNHLMAALNVAHRKEHPEIYKAFTTGSGIVQAGAPGGQADRVHRCVEVREETTVCAEISVDEAEW